MKWATAVALVSAAAGATAAPATRFVPRDNSTSAATYDHPSGFIFPRVIKNHDVNTNLNTLDYKTYTVRSGGTEKTTLYELPIPDYTAGKKCGLVVRASRIGYGDRVEGEQALDIFSNQITDLASLASGNFRNNPLARVRFNAATGFYDFDAVDVKPIIKEFPCPAGKTLEWESVSVGTEDLNIITQDYYFDGVHAPNGLTIAYW